MDGKFIIEWSRALNGYDENIINIIYKKLKVPLTLIGGAGSNNHISEFSIKYGPLGLGAGSLFVFKGKYKAVLINYPSNDEKNLILKNRI